MTLQQMIELIQLYHPKAGSVILTKLINNTSIRFAKDTYCTTTKAVADNMTSVNLQGSTGALPVTIYTSSLITLQAYKDATTDTVTLLPSASILFYTGFIQRDVNGAVVNYVSIVIEQDKTVYFYDRYGNSISEFPSEIETLEVYYVATPTVLSGLSDASIFAEDYNEAICDWIIGSLYPTKEGLQSIEKMQMEKHFKNRYDIQRTKALKYYRQNNTLMTVSGVVSNEFSS